MKKLLRLSLGALFILFTYNTVNAQVKNAYNITIDFHKYKTYSFDGWEILGIERLNELDKSLFLAAFEEEFKARNMTLVTDSADVIFTLTFRIDVGYTYIVNDDLSSSRNVVSYRHYGFVNLLNQYDYEVGTVIVDFFDGKTKEKVGQATMQKPLANKEKSREENISKTAKALMKKYPVKA